MQEEIAHSYDMQGDEGNLKKMKSLKDGGRRDVEAKGKVALGFVEDDVDYEVLVSRGVAYGKEYVISSSCSFHICCEKKKSIKSSVCDENLVNLPNNES